METTRKLLNIFFKINKMAFIIWSILLIGYAVMSVVLIKISHGSYPSHIIVVECWAFAIFGTIAITFYHHLKMYPYYISMGCARKQIFKESLVRNVIMSGVFAVIISIAFLIEYLSFGPNHLSSLYLGISYMNFNAVKFIEITLYHFCILTAFFGTFTFTASVFAKGGTFYGLTALFLMLSLYAVFMNNLVILFSWGYPYIFSGAILLIIGFGFNFLAWKFIKTVSAY